MLINWLNYFFFNYIIISVVLIMTCLFVNVTAVYFYKNTLFESFKLHWVFKVGFFTSLTLLYIIYFITLLLFSFADYSVLPYRIFFFKNWYYYFSNSLLFSTDSVLMSFSVDSISIIFLLLLTFLIPVCSSINVYSNYQLSYLKSTSADLNIKSFFLLTKSNLIYNILLLSLELILFLFFITDNIFFFYILFEMSMIPLYYMIGLFGSRVNRIKAAHYLFFFTVFGSIFFLVGILILLFFFGTLDIFYLKALNIPLNIQKIIWLFFFLPLAVKIPIFPLHIWLPEAHVEAPTEGSVLLAGLLLKIGLFGFIKFLIPVFPLMTFYYSPLISLLGLLGVFYVSCIIFTQIDFKKIIAYSSVAHMNYSLLGLFSSTYQGIQGSIYMMFTHGITSSGLFILVGFLYSRYNTRTLFYYQGIISVSPILASYCFLFVLSNSGIPLTGGFISEFLIFLGLLKKNIFVAIISITGPLLGAIYSFLLFVKIFYGSLSIFVYSKKKQINVMSVMSVENSLFFFFGLLVLITGLFPSVFLSGLTTSISLMI